MEGEKGVRESKERVSIPRRAEEYRKRKERKERGRRGRRGNGSEKGDDR